MKCPRCGVDLVYEPTREVQYERAGDRQHNDRRCADMSAERARRAEAENVKMAGGVGAWVRECSTRLDAEQAAHRATAEKLATAREALEEGRIACEPFDDIKPRRWMTDYENLARFHRHAVKVIAALDAEPGKEKR